jgi:hypothetical protein
MRAEGTIWFHKNIKNSASAKTLPVAVQIAKWVPHTLVRQTGTMCD